MFCIPVRNLAIAVCLVVQAMVTPCIPCSCGQGENENSRREQAFASPSEVENSATTRCPRCEVTGKTRQPSQLRSRDRQVQLPAATTQEPLLLDDDTIAFGVVALHNHSLPLPDAHELQVFLE